ncbi:MAG TPA: diguanylate cyclase [Azospirillaceae bacterium]|nr:diguanylate cyclase [Azospirillaceae bacterium]
MSLTHSIAGKLFRIIFSAYFAITAAVTATQLVAEYRETEERFYAELKSVEPTFREGVADAVWHFNRDGLNKILKGMLQSPVVLGVEVRDRRGMVLASAGRAPGAPGAPAVSRLGPAEWLHEDFSLVFPILYQGDDGDSRQLGDWVVYSSRALVVERLEYRVTSIIIASSVKASILLVIFLLVVDRVLGRPLKRLRAQLMAVNSAADEGEGRVALGMTGRNELTLVEETLNDTLSRLRRSNQELRDLTAAQEQKIAERTQELQIANRELERLSETDALTDLANRRKLEIALTDEWRRGQRSLSPLSAIMLDVDHFKAFNDAYGHRAGDDCLQMVGRILTAAARRPGDVAARYGGEEFVMLLPETDAAGAMAVAENIRRAVVEAATPHGRSATAGVVTLSLGVATADWASGWPSSPDELIDAADHALYAAKAAGRNQSRPAQPPQVHAAE